MAKKQEIQDKRFELYERAHTKEYYAVSKWLSEVKFSPAVFGVDQADMWRKIEKLCELYEDALDAERARNAKLERKLHSVTDGKRPEPQARPEPPKETEEPAVPKASKPVIKQPVSSSFDQKSGAPVQTERVIQSESVKANPAVSTAPEGKCSKASIQEEQVLEELLREFGPNKGGKPNG